MKAFVVTGSLAIFLAVPTVSRADVSVADVVAKYTSGDTAAALYLGGVLDGVLAASISYESSGTKPKFCISHKLILTVDEEVEIIKQYLKQHPTYGEFGVGTVLVEALRDAFPCSN